MTDRLLHNVVKIKSFIQNKFQIQMVNLVRNDCDDGRMNGIPQIPFEVALPLQL